MNTRYRNILIVRTDRIGDVILTTPAIRALRVMYPASRLTMLVQPATVDLVKGNPFLDEILVDDRQETHKGFWGYGRLALTLRQKGFDLAIIFHTKKRTNLLCFLAGIPERLGYANNKFGFLLTHKVRDDRPCGVKHETGYCLDLLEPLGREEIALEAFLPLQKEAEEWAEDLFRKWGNLSATGVVAVHPGASCPTKKWPAARFGELINILEERYGCGVILIGGKDNRETADQVLSVTRSPVRDMTGQTTVAQLASLLKRCRLLISNDSGPVHIADALKVPVISIFTRNQPGINPERWGPLGERSRALSPPLQKGISFAKGEVTDPRYLGYIQTEWVLEAVDSLFKLC